MMDLPEELLLQGVQEGKIYLFSADSAIGIGGHLHVCVRRGDRCFLFVVCTSQMSTISRLIQLKRMDAATFPCFKKDNMNKFDEEFTFINCNEVYECSNAVFIQSLSEKKIIPLDGFIDSSGMDQIVRGLLLSRTIPEEIKKLFSNQCLDVFCRSSDSAD